MISSLPNEEMIFCLLLVQSFLRSKF